MRKVFNVILVIAVIINLMVTVSDLSRISSEKKEEYAENAILINQITAKELPETPAGYAEPEEGSSVVAVTYSLTNEANCNQYLSPYSNFQYSDLAYARDDQYGYAKRLERDSVGNGFQEDAYKQVLPSGGTADYTEYLEMPSGAVSMQIHSYRSALQFADRKVKEVTVKIQ